MDACVGIRGVDGGRLGDDVDCGDVVHGAGAVVVDADVDVVAIAIVIVRRSLSTIPDYWNWNCGVGVGRTARRWIRCDREDSGSRDVCLEG